MNKMPEITDATRNTFVEAFCDLYREKAIEKISVKEVIAHAGYSRATFYNYFRDVYDLRDHAEDMFLESIIERVLVNIRSGRQMEDFVQTFMDLLQGNSFFIDVFMGSANNSRFIDKIYMKATPILIEALGINPDNRVAHYALKFYISGLLPTIGMWIKNEENISKEEFALLIRGILKEGFIRQFISNEYSDQR